jgi:hypothetical protein
MEQECEEVKAMDRIKLNFSLSALRAMRAQHMRLKRNEYLANGNSQHYQDLIERIEKLDEEIARREKDEHI